MTLHLTHLRSNVSQMGLALRGGASDFMVMVMVYNIKMCEAGRVVPLIVPPHTYGVDMCGVFELFTLFIRASNTRWCHFLRPDSGNNCGSRFHVGRSLRVCCGSDDAVPVHSTSGTFCPFSSSSGSPDSQHRSCRLSSRCTHNLLDSFPIAHHILPVPLFQICFCPRDTSAPLSLRHNHYTPCVPAL